MLIAIHEVKLYTQCHARSEAICSLLYVELSFMDKLLNVLIMILMIVYLL